MANTSLPDYPSELLWNGRQVDQALALEEVLYHRVEKLGKNGKISAIDSIRCPDTSFNRGKYSRPEHVLFGQSGRFLTWKITQCYVADIPSSLTNPNDGKVFTFRVEHDPVMHPDENYAHCEARAFHNQQRKKKLPSAVEKEFRQIVADAINRQLARGLPQQVNV